MNSKRGFTLLEAIITIFLMGVMAAVGYLYLNLASLQKIRLKTTLQSQFNLIESMVFQCKSLSEQFPKELNTSSDANETLLSELECNTTTPYNLNGGKYGFVPTPPGGFGPYRATESGSIFFVSTTAENNSIQDKVLDKLASDYTSTQASLEHNTTHATFKFYLSR